MINILNMIEIEWNNKNKTHFAVFNKKQIKYLIDIRDKNFYENLMKNQSSYTFKHKIFKKILKLIPLYLIGMLPNIRPCKVKINKNLKHCLNKNCKNEIDTINYIIGTEGVHQKIVLQVVSSNEKIYIKAGTKSAQNLIRNENYIYNKLSNMKLNFITPKLLFEEYYKDICISGLSEVKGDEISTHLTDEILDLYKTISKIDEDNEQQSNQDIEVEFSHGDFAPWNIKLQNEMFVVYDWEYAKKRFKGFDILHYVFQVEHLINKSNKEDALNKATQTAKRYVPMLNKLDDEFIKSMYIKEAKKTYME